VSGPQGHILVIRGGAIGDFILTLPALTVLRQQFPRAHLEVLGYPHIAQLALAGGVVDAVRPIEAQALAGFFARGGTLSEDWRDYFSDFDLILSYLYDPDGIFQENVARCSPAQFIGGPHRARDADLTHATQVYLKPLERLAIFEADAAPRLALQALPSPHRPLALHPGSGSERKNWPELRWRELLARLVAETDWHLLLVGGEAEGDRLERLASGLPRERYTLARSRPLAELAGLLQGCVGFVGHDSGITHLAAAVGVPCVVLWGDTVEAVWGPRGERLVVLREPAGLPAISVARVRWEIQELLGASR
jgi:ADP-heptose:LPS heptosyltransferase